MKIWLAESALVAAGVVAAFVIAEIVVRLAGLGPLNLYTYDPWLGWKMKPGASGWQRQEGTAYIHANRDGFRGPDYAQEKPKDTLRIAVLGDSFTEGQQVPYEDTFCAVMQRKLLTYCPLAAHLDGRPGPIFRYVEVMNFAVDGYGTAQELIVLRRWVWHYSPDMVMLAVFTGNDIRNNSVILESDKCRPFFVSRGDRLVLGGPFDTSFYFRMQCMLRFESRHLQTLNLLGSGRSLVRQRLRVAFAGNPRKPPVGAEPGIGDLIYLPPSSPVWRDAWRVTDGEIAMMNREVAGHGALFLVVTLANGIQDYPHTDSRQKYMRYIGSGSLFYPDDHIRELGAHEGFAVLNLARPMQAYADAHHAFLHGFPNTRLGTGHWNADGHRVAGELIARKVRDLLTAPSPASGPRAP